MSVPTITPQDLDRLRASGEAAELLDVRTPVEFRELHAAGARNAPLDRLDPAALPAAPGRLFVICRSGSRGRQAGERLLAAGRDVVNVEGGTLAWAEAGLPVVRGKKAVSLERQVRIAAGSLVLLGTALGWLVHEGFLAVPA